MQEYKADFFKKAAIYSSGSLCPLAIIFMLIAGFYAAPSLAAPAEDTIETPELLALLDNQDPQFFSRIAPPQTGHYPVRLNARLTDAFLPLPAVRFSLPKGTQYEVIQDNRIVHPSGSVTWAGYFKDYGSDYRVIITTQRGRSFGRILVPTGEELLVRTNDSGTWLIDPQEAGWLSGNLYDDAVPPLLTGESSESDLLRKRPLSNLTDKSAIQAQAATSSTIDVMLLYTPSMVTRYGSGLQARFDSLIALANQAYADSQVNLNLRLVHQIQVNYSETTSNDTALEDVTNGSDPSLIDVNAWRDQYGADLVALLRPYDAANHRNCGIAWLNGFNGQTLTASNGFAVVSDGDSIGGYVFCDDFVLAHELGHTMGSQHDRANATYQGAYPYSYGYGFRGSFGTIMSYINPRVGKFSNPDIACLGSQACGVADYADNARSLNNTRATVASFKTAPSTEPPPTEPPTSSSRLYAISTRGYVGTGESRMVAGFIITGSAPKKVLIMAKGPVMANEVSGTLSDPTLELLAGPQLIAANDNWGSAANAAEIQATGQVDPRYSQQESAILITLNPGAYGAVVGGASNTTGNALVEVYEGN
ncbi:MAG: hypothetical protein KDJ28_07130 [Candidatus Competibacteraceae bacterium]|nr:hypothetical protein [Candidatus Competibacteraceae bacterium]